MHSQNDNLNYWKKFKDSPIKNRNTETYPLQTAQAINLHKLKAAKCNAFHKCQLRVATNNIINHQFTDQERTNATHNSVLGIHVGASLQQQPRAVQVTTATGMHQRRVSVLRTRVYSICRPPPSNINSSSHGECRSDKTCRGSTKYDARNA